MRLDHETVHKHRVNCGAIGDTNINISSETSDIYRDLGLCFLSAIGMGFLQFAFGDEAEKHHLVLQDHDWASTRAAQPAAEAC